MLIKKAKYRTVSVKQKRIVKEEVHGCDECRTEIENWPNEPVRLDTTVFFQDGQTERLHFCSWRCALKHLPKIKTDYFISLPNVLFDSGNGKRSGHALVKLLSKKKL
jgi:hypothetical protein